MMPLRSALRRALATTTSSSSTALSADGTRIAYSCTPGDSGRAALVLIPGWGGVAADWSPVLPLLASGGRRVVTFDFRGMGASEAARGGAYDVASLMEDALCVARAAAASHEAPVDVLGHSLGGLVAQELAYTTPSEVRKVVLASTSPGGDGLKGLVSRDFFDVLDAWSDDEGSVDAERANRRAAAAYYVHGLPQAYVEDHVDDLKQVINAYVDAAAAPRSADAIAGMKRAILSPFPSAERFAGRPPKPTLVLHGDVDAIVDPFCGTQLAQHVPGAKLLLLAGVGHHAYTQEPAEWATLVADFLDGASSRPEAPSFELNA